MVFLEELLRKMNVEGVVGLEFVLGNVIVIM
jgi:hypothetical protein